MISSIAASGVGQAYGTRPPAPSPEERFQRLDGDGNGALDALELEAMAEKIAAKTGQDTSVDDLLDRFDADGNGTLESSEVPERPRGEFRGPPPFLGEDGSVAGTPETGAALGSRENLLNYLLNDESAEDSASLLDLQA